MQTTPEAAAEFAVHANRDERKSARLAAERTKAEPGARVVAGFATARDILRNTRLRQAGLDSAAIDKQHPEHAPVFYLDGELHRKKRAAIARFFTPKAIATRYRLVMEQTTDALLEHVRNAGQGRLDDISFELAVAVAADIVGLTESGQAGLAKRIESCLTSQRPGRWGLLRPVLLPVLVRYHALNFFYRDVRPAIRARRLARREDVISHLIDEGYSERAILVECMTYGAAGMVTTREFIVMAAWHLLERDALRDRFLAGSEDDQLATLEEILRLEPVAAMLHRRCPENLAAGDLVEIQAGTVFSIDIRAVNADVSVVGECPHALDPDRGRRMKVAGGFMSFGDGAHRCPGAQVAMHETRVFLDRLLRLPGIRFARKPDMNWCEMLMSYELRNAIVACDRGP
jgi:cytochrome P450